MEESFDTIFNVGYGSLKSPMGQRVKKCIHLLYIMISLKTFYSYFLRCYISLHSAGKSLYFLLKRVLYAIYIYIHIYLAIFSHINQGTDFYWYWSQQRMFYSPNAVANCTVYKILYEHVYYSLSQSLTHFFLLISFKITVLDISLCNKRYSFPKIDNVLSGSRL